MNNHHHAHSRIGSRMNQLTGVRAIMRDIAEALKNPHADLCNLSAGNPLVLPELETLWRELGTEVIASPEYGSLVGRYGMTQGYEPLIDAVVNDFNKRYGLTLTHRHVLITPGSQSLYFFAANVFGGYSPEGGLRHVVLPLSPDYTGYGGVSIHPEAVLAFKPLISQTHPHRFRYIPNLEALHEYFQKALAGAELKDNATAARPGCVIFSRPCNPSGNVMAVNDVQRIAENARQCHVPVFIDSAYAPPFPALNFTEMEPVWGPNIVHCMSLSKAGLPGERVGIAIGDPQIIQAIESFESNACIHSSRFGQAIAAKAISSGRLAALSTEVIRPFYRHKLTLLEEAFFKYMPDSIPWNLHEGEGSIFSWVWFDNLPVTDGELYTLLKDAGVVVVPGGAFFPGLSESWAHTSQCFRLSMTAPDAHITEGVRRMATVLDRLYSN